MNKIMSLFAMFLFICSVSSNLVAVGIAQEEHGKTNITAPTKMEHTSPTGAFKQEVVVKHIRSEFQIMSLASMNLKDPDGATHHVMVKLYDNSGKQLIKDVVGKIKVIGPDKSEQINDLKNYNGIFAANFTFNEEGKYGVICLVKIDGEKHLFKFWYPHE